MASGLSISMILWCVIVLIGYQLTSFAYPGIDMLGQIGLEHSKDIKSMLKVGYTIIILSLLLVITLAFIY